MADTSVIFVGRTLRSPIGVASHALFHGGLIEPKAEADQLRRYSDLGVGYVHTPFICPEEEHPFEALPVYRFMRIQAKKPFGREGLLSATEARRIMCRLKPGLHLIQVLRETLPKDVAVIANMIGPGSDGKGWAEHCKKAEDAGADIIEMNVSCPIPATEAKAVQSYHSGELSEAAGCLLGDSPELLLPVVEEVVKRVRIPVGVKLTPETGFPRIVGLVEGLKRVGTRFISGINASITCAPPDIYNHGQGQWPGLKANPICAAHGPWNRFLLYRNLGVISLFVPDMEQAGIGGLVEPEHIVEAMMLGARICELSSGLLWKGSDLIGECIAFLNTYMSQQGYKNVDDFIGAGVRYIRPVDELDWGLGEFVATVNEGACIRCGRCIKNLCTARSFQGSPKRVVVDPITCTRCGLCEAICPGDATKVVAQRHEVKGER